MKKLISYLMFAGLLVSSVKAAEHKTYSFLNAQSVNVTNLIGVTNFNSIAATALTNTVGTIYTNGLGQRVITTGYGTNDSVNLLKTVPLWTDSLGSFVAPIYTNQAPGAAEMAGPSYAQIFLRVVGGSGANTATSFVFAPVAGSDPDTGAYFGADSTASADLITITITPAGATQVTSLTKIDARKLVGCKGLMLKSITAGDTDASSQVTVLDCNLVGFVP